MELLVHQLGGSTLETSGSWARQAKGREKQKIVVRISLRMRMNSRLMDPLLNRVKSRCDRSAFRQGLSLMPLPDASPWKNACRYLIPALFDRAHSRYLIERSLAI